MADQDHREDDRPENPLHQAAKPGFTTSHAADRRTGAMPIQQFLQTSLNGIRKLKMRTLTG
jgi:hypothetical protein